MIVITIFQVILMIVIIIVAFAVSFHFLLSSTPAFSSMPYSIIKTLVWMLGDLGYDDVFLSEESPVLYPIEVNLLFVLFVTTIGGEYFVLNLLFSWNLTPVRYPIEENLLFVLFVTTIGGEYFVFNTQFKLIGGISFLIYCFMEFEVCISFLIHYFTDI